MANYLYKTVLYKNAATVIGIDKDKNITDTTDFETIFKSKAVQITGIIIGETTFIIDTTYAQFKAVIDSGEYTWQDVTYIDDDMYHLHLITSKAFPSLKNV